jgi:hypothetical protein
VPFAVLYVVAAAVGQFSVLPVLMTLGARAVDMMVVIGVAVAAVEVLTVGLMALIDPPEVSDSDEDFAEAIPVKVLSFAVLYVVAAAVGQFSVLPVLMTLGARAVVVTVGI